MTVLFYSTEFGPNTFSVANLWRDMMKDVVFIKIDDQGKCASMTSDFK